MPVTALTKGLARSDRLAVHAAYRFALKHLSDVHRRSGQNYALHGAEVARAVAEAAPRGEILSIALLHDLLMHPDGAELLKRAPLTQEQRALVGRMHELRRLHIDENTADLDRVIDAFAADPTILLLRMAHRLNDVRQLYRFSPALRKSIARETLHMYSAIAGRLGLHVWRHEMEDICFTELEPKKAEQLRLCFHAMTAKDHVCFEQTMRYLKKSFRAENMRCSLSFRTKTLYSTYRKMLIKNRRFEELTDRLAIRIVVPDIPSCYRALGIVHANMHPIPGKLKDYIGSPKQNGYRSIHTVVYPLPSVTEQPMEIQIRTPEMHHECELGIAAHTVYKDMQYALSTSQARVDLFRNLSVLRDEVRSPEQFEQALRNYYRADHLLIFDDAGKLYQIPKPATALDFVVHAFTQRAAFLKEISINGRKRPIHTLLHDGDTVKVVFGRLRTLEKRWVLLAEQESVRGDLKRMLRNVVTNA